LVEKQLPSVIYHYTTREGLLGILNEGFLWATDIRYLNDSNEFELAKKVLFEVMDKPNGVPFNKNEKKVLDGIKHWMEKTSDQLHSYVCSFSEKEDLLSQWRGYTKPGDGYAIGFFTNDLKALLKKPTFSLEYCRYEKIAQKELVERFLRDVIRSPSFKPVMANNCYESSMNLFFEHLPPFMSIAPLIKDESFKEECEWRLVAPFSGALPNKLCFRSGKSALKPYIPFCLKNTPNGELPIFEVVIGPSPHGNLDKQAVMRLLKQKNAKRNECQLSKIPFRDW
jgi:hypothetical protein